MNCKGLENTAAPFLIPKPSLPPVSTVLTIRKEATTITKPITAFFACFRALVVAVVFPADRTSLIPAIINTMIANIPAKPMKKFMIAVAALKRL